MGKLKTILTVSGGVILLAVLIVFVLSRKLGRTNDEVIETDVDEAVELLYGIDSEKYNVADGVIADGETMGQIFARYGVNPTKVDEIARKAEGVKSLKSIRAGNNYATFVAKDSTARLAYFVYEATTIDYMVIDLTSDTVNIHMAEKEVSVRRAMKSGTITSSLWNCMMDNGMSPMMAMQLSDIFAWTIDFFALQKDDKFTVIYDERYVDTVDVGIGTIWGARFEHGGKTYYAVPYLQDGKVSYWDENGNSLRKNLLKAPLTFSRISSRFSNSRLHPVLRIRRPHHGVDYAAPSGTPVVAVGDGVVVFKGYSGGGGNTIKIKHNSGSLMSGYLHLKGYGPGIKQGSRVRQGQLIGYVGSTGLSTGPHLDFRIWRNGTPIDPLKVPSEPAEPVRAENKATFMKIKERVIAELNGQLADSLKVTSLEGVKEFTPTVDTVVKEVPAQK